MGRRKSKAQPTHAADDSSARHQSRRGSMGSRTVSKRGTGQLQSQQSRRAIGEDYETSPMALGRRASNAKGNNTATLPYGADTPSTPAESRHGGAMGGGHNTTTPLYNPIVGTPQSSFRGPPPANGGRNGAPFLAPGSPGGPGVTVGPASIVKRTLASPGEGPPAAAPLEPAPRVIPQQPSSRAVTGLSPESLKELTSPMTPARGPPSHGAYQNALPQGGGHHQPFMQQQGSQQIMMPYQQQMPPPMPQQQPGEGARPRSYGPPSNRAMPQGRQSFYMPYSPNPNPYAKWTVSAPPHHLQPLQQQQQMHGAGLPTGPPCGPQRPPHGGAWPQPVNTMQPGFPRQQSFVSPGHAQQQLWQQQQQQQQQPASAQGRHPSLTPTPAAQGNPATGVGTAAFSPRQTQPAQSQFVEGGSLPTAQNYASSSNVPQNGVTTPVPATTAAAAPPLVRTTSILKRESSFSKKNAPASAFPPQLQQQQQQQVVPAPDADTSATVARTTSILNRRSSFTKENQPASAFPTQAPAQGQQALPPQQRQQPRPQVTAPSPSGMPSPQHQHVQQYQQLQQQQQLRQQQQQQQQLWHQQQLWQQQHPQQQQQQQLQQPANAQGRHPSLTPTPAAQGNPATGVGTAAFSPRQTQPAQSQFVEGGSLPTAQNYASSSNVPQNGVTTPVPATTAAAAPPLVRTTSILKRESSFSKKNAPASAFPPQQQQQQQQQQQTHPFPSHPPPSVDPVLSQQRQQAPGRDSHEVPAAPSPVSQAPALVRTASILNRTSSFNNKSKIESAADTKRRHEAELAKKQEQRAAEIERARVEQLARDVEMRRLKEERLRRVLGKQRQRAERHAAATPEQDSSATEEEPAKHEAADPAEPEMVAEGGDDKAPPACSAPDVAETAAGTPESTPPDVSVQGVNCSVSPQRMDSCGSGGGSGSLERSPGENGANTSLIRIDDSPEKNSLTASQQPLTTTVPKDGPPPPSPPSPATPAATVTQATTHGPAASSPLGRSEPAATAAPANSEQPKGPDALTRASTLVLYEIPLRRHKGAEANADKNPVKTYGKDCNEIRVTQEGDGGESTAMFTVDELIAHRKSSTYMESKLLNKVAASVTAGRSACVFCVDSSKLSPPLSSSPMEAPTWFAQQWLANNLAKRLLGGEGAQNKEEDFQELAVSLALIHTQQGGSSAVVSDLLLDSAATKPAPLQFSETPLLGKRVSGVTYQTVKEEGDFVSLFTRAQSNASQVLCSIEDSTSDPNQTLGSVVVVVTCVLTQRKPGRLPDLGDTETWCNPSAEGGLNGGFLEESDHDDDDVDAPDFLTRPPPPPRALRKDEGDVVRSCLTMVGVDDRFPLLLAPAEAASGKLASTSPIDPRLRSWLKSLMVGAAMNVVLCSIDPTDTGAASTLTAQKALAAVGHRPPRYNSCRRALARELTSNPLASAANAESAMDVVSFVREVEACRALSRERFAE